MKNLIAILMILSLTVLTSCQRESVTPTNTYTNTSDFIGNWEGEPLRPLSNGDTTVITHVSGNTYTITNFDYIVRQPLQVICDTLNNTIDIDSWSQGYHVIGNGYLYSDTLYIVYSIENTQWQNYSSEWYKMH